MYMRVCVYFPCNVYSFRFVSCMCVSDKFSFFQFFWFFCCLDSPFHQHQIHFKSYYLSWYCYCVCVCDWMFSTTTTTTTATTFVWLQNINIRRNIIIFPTRELLGFRFFMLKTSSYKQTKQIYTQIYSDIMMIEEFWIFFFICFLSMRKNLFLIS